MWFLILAALFYTPKPMKTPRPTPRNDSVPHTTTNDAAKQLHAFLGVPMIRDETAHRLIDDAISAERHATVMAIRESLATLWVTNGKYKAIEIHAILAKVDR